MRKVIKILSFLILLPSLLCTLLSISAYAQEKIVRVGWFESKYNISDEYGRRSGYSYDYQQALAVYTGWKYEYVTGSWPELLEKIINNEIDLLSDVSYTEERAEKMIYSSTPMGSEDYYIYKSPDNKTISIDDYSTFSGKKIGINKNSVMVSKFNDWASKNHVDAQVVELIDSVDEALKKLHRGEIDLYANMDGSISIDEAIPLCKFGSSDFYFAVSKTKPELAEELNRAMTKLLEVNPYYNIGLHSKYFKTSGANLYLSEEEKEYINNHGKIKVGYQDNYLAFCAKDDNGKLTGALKDYLNIASECFKNGNIEFDPIAYPTATAALDALKKGEVDCMFPANLSLYDGEKKGLFITSPFIKTEIVAVVPEAAQKNFLKNENIKVAVNKGNPNYDLFLKDNFPDWQSVYFDSTEDCLKGINEGRADCLLISNYRFNNLASICNEYKLVNLSTGVEMDYCFAVDRGSMVLHSILNKIVNNVSESSVNSAISFYYTEDVKQGFGDYLNEYFAIIMIVLAVIAIVFLGLILRMIYIDRKSKSNQMLIKATEIDEITGLYNKTFFLEYANNLYLESIDKKMDAAVIYIDRFHSISDLNGNDFGIQLLKEVSDEIKSFIKKNGGIAGYSIDGRFALYFNHLDDYQDIYDKIQGRIDMISPFANIKIRMGVMPWQKDTNPSQLIEQAIVACSMSMTESMDYLIVIDEKMKMKEERNKKLLEKLRSAIDNNEFKIYYQPKYDIVSNKIIGAEALLRWDHPELGIIEPKDFIPLFEKNGEIVSIDQYVRKAVIKQLAIWKEKYGFVLPISLNVSRADVLDQTFEYSINVLMDEYQVDRDSLIIEINENALVDNVNQFASIIKKLRSHGYKIELDDFGNGYLSLKLLSLISFDVLKIDGSIIEGIDTNDKNALFVKIVVGLAKELDTVVIAEGVETEVELNMLKEAGCNYAQGYYLAKPLLSIDFEELVFKK